MTTLPMTGDLLRGADALTATIDTVVACCEDEQVGLAASVRGLIEPQGARLDRFRAVPYQWRRRPWTTTGALQRADLPSVFFQPMDWRPEIPVPPDYIVRGLATLRIGWEMVNADAAAVELGASVWSAALVAVLTGLRDYSDRAKGTVLNIPDALLFNYGNFGAAGQSLFALGFTCTVTLLMESETQ